MALLAARTPKNAADWTDRELLKFVLRSDARGWAELVRRFRPLIYRCITKVTLKYAPSLSGADLDEIERRYIIRVIKLLNGNKARAAQLLGLDRRTLYRKLERYEARGQRAEGIERQSNVTEQ